MKNFSKYIIFTILTLFFTGVIFLIDTFFLSDDLRENPEERYIDESLESSKESNEKINYIEVAKKIIKDKEIKEEVKTVPVPKAKILSPGTGTTMISKEKPNINFGFVPNIFEKKQEKNKSDLGKTLHNDVFYSFLHKIDILFYKEKGDIRGRMKNKQIKLFGPQYMDNDELVSIFIHEFSHYIDIYHLKRGENNDISDKFYDISWYSTKVLKEGLTGSDFVSGYSMSNKYEDFAESLTYYILHNKDFLEKTKKSYILRKKYNFFSFYLFKSNLFKNTDFSEDNKIENYYRDITKIDFSRKNFLQYLKKSI